MAGNEKRSMNGVINHAGKLGGVFCRFFSSLQTPEAKGAAVFNTAAKRAGAVVGLHQQGARAASPRAGAFAAVAVKNDGRGILLIIPIIHDSFGLMRKND